MAKVLQNVIPKDTVEESINKVSDEEIDDSSYGDSAPKSVETSTNSSLTGSNIAAETDENISSNTGNIVRVDDAQKSADDSRIKHDELLLKDLKV